MTPSSWDNLGNKQTIIIHNCLINDEKYDLVITPHRQSVGNIRTKKQALRKKIIHKQKQKQVIRKRFSKRRNAVSESEKTAIHELHNLKDSKNKNHQIDDQLYFTDSETTSQASVKAKRENKKLLHKQTNTFAQLESTDKTHSKSHINSNSTQKWFKMKITPKNQYFHFYYHH